MSQPVPVSRTPQPEVRHAARTLVEIPLRVCSPAKRTLRQVPLTSGFCLPQGLVADDVHWTVTGLSAAESTPAQTEVLDRWADGSIRWLLARFVAAELKPGDTPCQLRPGSPATDSNESEPQTTLAWRTDSFLISAAPSTALGAGLIATPRLRDGHGRLLTLAVEDIHYEACGPLYESIVAETCVSRDSWLQLQFRFEIWPTTGHVRLQIRIRNTRRARHRGGLWDLGDPGSFLFRELSVAVTSPDIVDSAELQWCVQPDGKIRTGKAADRITVTQSGSGGRAWSSSNHVSAGGQSAIRDRGYEAESAAGTLRGYRCEPLLTYPGHNASLTIAVPDFWQKFPTRLRTEDACVRVQQFPDLDSCLHELQGGEQSTQELWISIQSALADPRTLQWTYRPPRVVQPSDWIQQTKVFAWFPGPVTRTGAGDSGAADRFNSYVREATTGAGGLQTRRETIDEYGWRNYGDLPADHEQRHYPGRRTVVSHYNNQFDMVLGGILNLAASANPVWFDWFEPLARHVIDIDLYHTQQDRAAYNGGMFWHTDHYVDAATATHRSYSVANATGSADYGGGLSCEHNYSTGLLTYYYLTGSRDARAAVISLADWVLAMDDGTRTIWGLLDSGPTGLASRTVRDEFHGPGRGVGNSINTLLDGWQLTGQDHYLHKAEELIYRSVSPDQDCDALHLLDAEGHWSYTVCLTAICRYLLLKRDAGQLDSHYAYARKVLARYGRWMAARERPSLSEPDKLEYPTEAWAAQDFRKANVLRLAACCCDDSTAEPILRQRADELSDAAWHDLYSFGNQHLTARCLSILLTEGLRDVFHRTCPADLLPPSDSVPTESQWSEFVPQKTRVRRLLRSPTGLARAAGGLLNPRRWWRTLDAVRRQL